MSSSLPTSAGATVRRTLNRRRVLQTALDYVDQHGFKELSMRRLATELGVEAMALYKHVTSKDDLESGVAELIWEKVAAAAPPDDDWQTWLSTYGRAIRDTIHQHPGAVALWLTHAVAPVPALELFDTQLARCRPDAREGAAGALRAVSAFAVGFATSELSWFAAPITEEAESDAQVISRIARALPTDAPDRLIDIALLVCAGDTSDLFATTLDLMVKGLTR